MRSFVSACFLGLMVAVAALAGTVPAAMACVADSPTVLLPSRTELPAGMRLTQATEIAGKVLPEGTVLSSDSVTSAKVRVPVNTFGCGVTHVPASFAGFIFMKDVRD